MNYIYNIRVNLKPYLINFYEWSKEDNIILVNKLPLIYVKEADYINILNMSIELEKEELNKLALCENLCLFSNSYDVLCVHFSNKGIIDKISKLMLIEEAEVLDELNSKKISYIKYKLINNSNNYKFITRYECCMIDKILNYIKSNKDSKDVIDYLYYEWFNNTKSNNKYEKLLEAIRGEYSNKHIKLYNVIQIMEYSNA